MQKRVFVLTVWLALFCLLLTGCALFGNRQGGKSSETSVPKNEAGTNVVPATLPLPDTNTSNGRKVPAAASPGKGGTGPGLGGSQVGVGGGRQAAEHGPVFYFYIFFAAAIVVWLVWATWQGYHRHRRHTTRVRHHPRRRIV